jgi:hypothetical protein
VYGHHFLRKLPNYFWSLRWERVKGSIKVLLQWVYVGNLFVGLALF